MKRAKKLLVLTETFCSFVYAIYSRLFFVSKIFREFVTQDESVLNVYFEKITPNRKCFFSAITKCCENIFLLVKKKQFNCLFLQITKLYCSQMKIQFWKEFCGCRKCDHWHEIVQLSDLHLHERMYFHCTAKIYFHCTSKVKSPILAKFNFKACGVKSMKIFTVKEKNFIRKTSLKLFF